MSLKDSLKRRKVTGKKLVFGSLLEVIIDTDKYPNDSDQRIENWSAKTWEQSGEDMLKHFKEVNIQNIQNIPIPEGANENEFRKQYKEVSEITLKEAKNFLRIFIPEQIKATKLPRELRVGHFDQIRALARKVDEDNKGVGSLVIDDFLWKVKDLKTQDVIIANQEHALEAKDKKYFAAESQQLLTQVGDSLSRGEFKENPTISQYPSVVIETKDKRWGGHAEIKPLDTEKEIDGMPIPEESLISAMKEISKSLGFKGVETDYVSKAAVSLWLEKKDRTGWANISLDDICERVGLKRRSDKDGQSRFDTKQRDSIRGALEKAARVQVVLKNLPDHLKRERLKKVSDPFIMIRNRVSPQEVDIKERQGIEGELWGNEKWERVVIQPGAIMVSAIEEYGRQFMLLPTGLYARLKGYQDRNTQLLGMKLHQIFRFKAEKEGQKFYSFRINTLLDYADITLDVKAEKRLTKALDTCCMKSVGAIKSYKIPETMEQVKSKTKNQRVTKGVMRVWQDQMVMVEVPAEVYESYNSITRKKPKTLN
tara:strand:- start:1401 stop:3014 length:1614 start_codon:yes stop_codon:yes gene_type:complete